MFLATTRKHMKPSARRWICLSLFLIAAFSSSSVWAATRYLSSVGSDSGACTSGAPCLTFSYAKSVASAGDDFEFSPGLYTGTGITGFSGVNSANPSEAYCETVLGCTIKGTAPVAVTGATYHDMKIRGFFLWGTGENPSLSIESPDGTALASQTYNIEVSTTFGYSEINTSVNSSGWQISRISSSTFINVGSIGQRYAILVYGCYKVRFHRALVSWHRWNPSGGQNPAGGFTAYDTQDSTFTHIFVHDTQAGTDGDILDKTGIYTPSNDNGVTAPFTTNANLNFYAGAVINNNLGNCFGNEGGSGGSNSNINLINFALLGCQGVGITVPTKSSSFSAQRVTISSTNWAGTDGAMYGGGGGSTVSNSSIINSNVAFGPNDGINGAWANTYTNVFGFSGSAYSGGATAGTGDSAVNPAFVHAIISTSTALAGDGLAGVDMGADLRFEYSAAGVATATSLFPLPYECAIKEFYTDQVGLTYGVFGTSDTYTQYFFKWRYGNNPPASLDSTCDDEVAVGGSGSFNFGNGMSISGFSIGGRR
jgi:hypothetical protein